MIMIDVLHIRDRGGHVAEATREKAHEHGRAEVDLSITFDLTIYNSRSFSVSIQQCYNVMWEVSVLALRLAVTVGPKHHVRWA